MYRRSLAETTRKSFSATGRVVKYRGQNINVTEHNVERREE